MKRVSREAFFAVINKLDVHPTPQGSYIKGRGYLTHWKLRDGSLVGVSHGLIYELKDTL